jgi:hydrogenase maturation protease
MQIAVIGIGQSMRGDDAAGLEAVRLWQRIHASTAERPEVQVAMVEEPVLELVDLLDGMDAAILVDAVCSGATAGTLHHIESDRLSDFQDESASTHGWGIARVLRLCKAMRPKEGKPRIRILGIEAEQMEAGADLTLPIRRALPFVSSAIEEEIKALLGN